MEDGKTPRTIEAKTDVEIKECLAKGMRQMGPAPIPMKDEETVLGVTSTKSVKAKAPAKKRSKKAKDE